MICFFIYVHVVHSFSTQFKSCLFQTKIQHFTIYLSSSLKIKKSSSRCRTSKTGLPRPSSGVAACSPSRPSSRRCRPDLRVLFTWRGMGWWRWWGWWDPPAVPKNRWDFPREPCDTPEDLQIYADIYWISYFQTKLSQLWHIVSEGFTLWCHFIELVDLRRI